MSMLRPSDRELHYCDNSHRWIAPPDVEQGAWNAGMRVHMDAHLATMGGWEDPSGASSLRSPGRPRF